MTYSDTSEQDAGHRVLYCVSGRARISFLMQASTNLISNHRQELPIFVC
jgi:hypothetical protein